MNSLRDGFDFEFQEGGDTKQIMELATLDFARRKQGS